MFTPTPGSEGEGRLGSGSLGIIVHPPGHSAWVRRGLFLHQPSATMQTETLYLITENTFGSLLYSFLQDGASCPVLPIYPSSLCLSFPLLVSNIFLFRDIFICHCFCLQAAGNLKTQFKLQNCTKKIKLQKRNCLGWHCQNSQGGAGHWSVGSHLVFVSANLSWPCLCQQLTSSG